MALTDKYKSLLSNKPNVVERLKGIGYHVEEDAKYLNSGYNADVYLVDDKYVMKFTNESHDYERWRDLIGHKRNHIASTLYASKLDTDDEDMNFLIVQKYYEKEVRVSSYSAYSESDPSIIFLFINYLIHEHDSQLVVPFGEVYEGFKVHCEEYGSPLHDVTKTEQFVNQLYNAFKDLDDEGYWGNGYIDLHAGNIRFDDKGVLKIIDF